MSLSPRIKKFHSLIRAANDSKTEWLIANLRDYRPERDVTRLSMLACLRVIASRMGSGRPHRERMQAAKAFVFGNVQLRKGAGNEQIR